MGCGFPSGGSALRGSADRRVRGLGAGCSFLSRARRLLERYAVKAGVAQGARCILGPTGHREARSGWLPPPYRYPHQEPKARSLWHGRRRQVREFGKMDSELREKGCLGSERESEAGGWCVLRSAAAVRSFERE